MPIIDLTGQRFGKLVVVEHSANSKDHAMWLCQCDCGKQIVVRGSSLRNGHSNSCGCNRPKNIVQNIVDDYVDGTQLSQLKSKPSKKNTSGVVGVCWNKRAGKWSAYITFRGTRYDLGLYENKLDAIKAREEAEAKLFANSNCSK